MRKILLLLMLPAQIAFAGDRHEPDSVYLFSYAKDGRSGLHFAWSRDKENWRSIGNEYSYLKSDYGRWGSEKRINSPSLLQAPDGKWHCVWSVNEREKVFAHASSSDLVYWGRQSYPFIKEGDNFLRPLLQYDNGSYAITYASSNGKSYRITTRDFSTYSPAVEVPAVQPANITASLPSGTATGQVHRVPWDVVDKLIKNIRAETIQGQTIRRNHEAGRRALCRPQTGTGQHHRTSTESHADQ